MKFFHSQGLARFSQTLILGGEAFGNNRLPFLQKGLYRFNVLILPVKLRAFLPDSSVRFYLESVIWLFQSYIFSQKQNIALPLLNPFPVPFLGADTVMEGVSFRRNICNTGWRYHGIGFALVRNTFSALCK